MQPVCMHLPPGPGVAGAAHRRGPLLRQLQQPPRPCQQRAQLSDMQSASDRPRAVAASAAAAAPAAVAGRRPCSSPVQPLEPLRLQTAVCRRRRQHHGVARRTRAGTRVCAAAGVLQPPVAGETLTQLAARLMVCDMQLRCVALVKAEGWRYTADMHLQPLSLHSAAQQRTET
jgi:hypothetical protein